MFVPFRDGKGMLAILRVAAEAATLRYIVGPLRGRKLKEASLAASIPNISLVIFHLIPFQKLSKLILESLLVVMFFLLSDVFHDGGYL
jgi:hypothetical protein